MNEASVQHEAEPQINTNIHTVESLGKKVTCVETVPQDTSKAVGNRVIVAGGWSTNENTYDGLRQALAKRGRRTTTFNHPRWGGDAPPVPVDPRFPRPTVELRKAANLLAVIQAANDENPKADLAEGEPHTQVDVVSHSEGAIYTLLAACMAPDRFKSIVLVGGAGMVGTDTLKELVLRFKQKMGLEKTMAEVDRRALHEQGSRRLNEERAEAGMSMVDPLPSPPWQKPDQVQHALKASMPGLLTYIVGNPLRALQEGIAIAKTDITEMLDYVLSQGINVVVVHGKDDEAMPLQRVSHTMSTRLESARAVGPEDNISPFQVPEGKGRFGFIVTNTLHDDVAHHPEVFATLIDEGALKPLDRIAAKTQSGIGT